MPEEGRWCGDAGEVMTFFLEIYLATIANTILGIDLATIGPRRDCQHAMWPPEAHEFDTPVLNGSLAFVLTKKTSCALVQAIHS